MSHALPSRWLAVGLIGCLLLLPAMAFADLHYDAQLLALDFSGELTAPPALVQSIEADLTVIFAEWPWFATIGTRPEPGWEPSHIFVGLTPAAMQQVVAGTYTGLDQLNAQYGPVDIQVYAASNFLALQFEALYHSAVLAGIYATAEGVVYAEANAVLGSPESDIDCQSSTRYRVWHGWVDCLMGCSYQRYWVLDIVGGHTVLVDSGGSIPPNPIGEVAAPPVPGTARHQLLPSAPNPFNPTTTLTYVLGAAGQARLEVFDPRGRRVTTVVDAWQAEGAHRAVVSLSGRDVASGVYVVRLSVDGQPVGTQRIALVR